MSYGQRKIKVILEIEDEGAVFQSTLTPGSVRGSYSEAAIGAVTTTGPALPGEGNKIKLMGVFYETSDKHNITPRQPLKSYEDERLVTGKVIKDEEDITIFVLARRS